MDKPTITQILSILQKEYPSFLETTIKQAGEWGQSLHQAIECINNNIEFEINGDDEIFEKCIKNYQQFMIENEITIIETEKEVENEYCKGHIDCIANINEKLTIIDYKTGQKSKLWKLQLGAYWYLYNNAAQGLILSFDKKTGELKKEYYTENELCEWGGLVDELIPLYNFLKNKSSLTNIKEVEN